MAKKGAKGTKQKDDAGDGAEQQEQPVAGPSGAGADQQEDSDASEGEASGQETRSRMLKRHKAEMTAHKKAVQRMGKKSKDEIAKLNKEIEDRHAAELSALDSQAAATSPQEAASVVASDAQAATAEIAHMSIMDDGGKKLSKAQKRREKQQQEEVERQARIAEELASMGPSDRMKEEEQLAKLLQPLNLGMREIKADGNCLYRSIEDQLSQLEPSAPTPSHVELRQKAAAYIRAHPDNFMPFIYDEDKNGDPGAQLEAYCEELESTAVWGGQLELGALAEALKCKIEVHAVGIPVVTLGEDYPDRTLRLCYMRHAFGLGEHYNSVELIKNNAATVS